MFFEGTNDGQDRKGRKTLTHSPKEKHFKCTRCGNPSDHLTTKKTLCGQNIIPEDEAFCKRCTTYWEKKYINIITTKIKEENHE